MKSIEIRMLTKNAIKTCLVHVSVEIYKDYKGVLPLVPLLLNWKRTWLQVHPTISHDFPLTKMRSLSPSEIGVVFTNLANPN